VSARVPGPYERRALWLAVAAVVALHAPSMDLPLIADDLVQRVHILAHLSGHDARGAAWDLYGYRPTAAERALAVWAGASPWWSSPTLQIAMFRPLAAATHYLDYALWPNALVAMHLHSLAWYLALVLVVARLYRRLLGPGPAAALALLLFAIDEAHVYAVSWIASRNTVMTALFVALTLGAHHAWRSEGRRAGAVLAPCWLVLAQLSSEGAIAAWAYLLAYALCIDEGNQASRALALAPMAAVTVVHQVIYRLLGYGVIGSGLYLDPSRAPRAFLAQLPERWLRMLDEQLSLPSTVLRFVPAAARLPAVIVSWVLLAWFLAAVLALCRRERSARFWLLGSALSLVPVCSVAIDSSPRLLLVSGIGAFALLGQLTAAGLGRARPWPARGLAAAIVLVHGVLAAALCPGVATTLQADQRYLERGARSIAAAVRPGDQVVAILQTPHAFMSMINLAQYAQLPGAKPAHLLGASLDQVRITHDGATHMVLTPAQGYLREPWSVLVRSASEPFAAGSTIPLLGLAVTVEALTADARPARVAIDAAKGVAVAWLTWSSAHERYERLDPSAMPSVLRLRPEPPAPH